MQIPQNKFRRFNSRSGVVSATVGEWPNWPEYDSEAAFIRVQHTDFPAKWPVSGPNKIGWATGTSVASISGVFGRYLAVLIALAVPLLLRAGPEATSEIPFVLQNGLIWLEVNVPQSPKPLTFLFDSGASVSTLNLGTARRLGMKPGPTVRVGGVNGTSRGHWPQRLDAKLGGVSLPKNFLAVDLAELSDACECGVDGLVGADFLRGRIVQVDYVSRVLRLLARPPAEESATVLDLKRVRGAVLAPVRVNGGSAEWFRLDTGCSPALQWVCGDVPKGTSAGLSVALTEMTIPVATTTVRLGELELKGVPTGLHRRPIFRGEKGLLGNGLLGRFERVTFDDHSGKLTLSGSL